MTTSLCDICHAMLVEDGFVCKECAMTELIMKVDVHHATATWGLCNVCDQDFDQGEGTCYFAPDKSPHGYDYPMLIICNDCDPHVPTCTVCEGAMYGHEQDVRGRCPDCARLS